MKRNVVRTWSSIWLLASLGVASLMSCDGCRNSHVYVPFDTSDPALRDDPTKPDASGSVSSAAPKTPIFKPIAGTLAPPSSSALVVDRVHLAAPPNTTFVATVSADLDGDGQKEVVAYVQNDKGGGDLLLFSEGKSARSIGDKGQFSLPVPCIATPSPAMLTLVGPHSISLDLRPACGDAASAAHRFYYVAFGPGDPNVRWSARLTPPSGFDLDLAVETTDRDGDGVDDPTFIATIKDPGDDGRGLPNKASGYGARIRYYDRPAGLARDRQEPETSFQVLAGPATALASKKTQAADVNSVGRRVTLTFLALCREAGAPWLEIDGERGVACSSSRALEDVGAAQVRAGIILGDAFYALWARERLQGPTPTKNPKLRADLDKAIYAAFPTLWASTKELKAAVSNPSRDRIAWGSLVFAAQNDLLVRTSGCAVRYDLTSQSESEACDVQNWPWEVALPGQDAVISSAVDTCANPLLGIRLAGHSVPTGSFALTTTLLPSAKCGISRHHLAPVAFAHDGMVISYDGALVTVPTDYAHNAAKALEPGVYVDATSWTSGSPRSPNGAFLVLPTRLGIVRREESSKMDSVLIRSKDWESNYDSLRECAVANNGAVACVHENHVVVFDPSQPAAPSAPSASASNSAPKPAPSIDDGMHL